MGTWDVRRAGVVVLPDGRSVRGRGLRDGATSVGDDAPELGLYLTAREHREPGWESWWIRWPDFRLPHSTPDALAALRDAFERAATTKVEIACSGGTGRTGTAIAVLARYAGLPAEDVVTWVRRSYRAGAVETPGQRRFVREARLAPWSGTEGAPGHGP